MRRHSARPCHPGVAGAVAPGARHSRRVARFHILLSRNFGALAGCFLCASRPSANLAARLTRNWVLAHRGAFRCTILTGALVPRRGTAAGVPGPRRNADDCDAGWFAPVATLRRPLLFRHAGRSLAVPLRDCLLAYSVFR